ncbi:MAG TPA: sensor domain-containing diguanylate cyclase [Verrucomicrobiae bacterium]|nr:sensor domain-containing diguanylate cyclase [Verrucomicrobiae bacterium]
MTAADFRIAGAIVDNVELVKLHEFSLIVNSTHNIDQIVKQSAKAIREILAGDGCHILLASRIRDELRLQTAFHDGGKPFPPGVDETQGISGTTFSTGEIILVTDAENDARVTKEMQRYFRHKSMVSVPIFAKDQVVGVTVIYSKQKAKYDFRDAEFLLILASHLGMAVENAHLMLRLKNAAATDPLTGAFNHGYFRDELDHLIKGHGDEMVSLIMMDVNDLKVINDTYGHTTGDQVLQEVALVLKQSVRGKDIVSRYGGDEFAIILPGADAEEAMGVAQRIQDTVASRIFSYNEGLRVSVSWGTISTKCKDISCINSIIDAADGRLYNMKRIKDKQKATN